MINRGGCFFESFEDDNEEDDDALQMRLDGGGEFDGVEADWFVFKFALSDNVDIESEIAELADKADGKISPVIRLAGEKGNVKVEIAMFYASNWNTEIRSYVNNFTSQRGGSHCDGLRAGLADAFNEYLLKQEINCSKITKSDVGEGLYAVIKVNDPDFAFAPGTNKVKNKDLGENVKSIVKKRIRQLFKRKSCHCKRVIR